MTAFPAPVPQPNAAAAVAAHAISDTLRIPLAARALGDAMFPAMAVHDADAAELLRQLGDDGSRWVGQRSTIYGVLSRTRVFRDLAATWLRAHPGGQVVNLGCGLSNYFQWLDDGSARMIDSDLPDALRLRRELLGTPANPRHRLAEVDLCRPGWWQRLGLASAPGGEPVFLMSEGVLMYLTPENAHAVLAEFGAHAPAGSVLAFDAMAWLAVGRGQQHPAIGQTRAEIAWGPRRLTELTAPHPRLRLAAVHGVMERFNRLFGITWPLLQRLLGVPMYAVYEMRVGG